MASTKRKQDDTEDEFDRKKPRLDEETNILELSDCTLLILLSFLDATSLYFLGQTCQRLHELVKDPRLWKVIDARRSPNTLEKVQYCEERINDRTTRVLFAADSRCKEIVSNRLFKGSVGQNLTVLALENQRIDGKYYPLRTFPNTLEELSLRRTYVSGATSFFRFAKNLEKLKVLILDRCLWLQTSNLMSIANLQRLEVLSLYMCKNLSDTNIGYISLSGIYGFKNLKVLDARFTGLGNQLLSSLYKSTSIQRLYFQGYCTTYHLDRYRRKLAIKKGAKQLEYSYISDDDEHGDIRSRDMKRKFGPVDFAGSFMDVVDDKSIVMYKYVEVNTEPQEPPKTVLYRDPYPECTCGFASKFWNVSAPPPNKPDDSSSSDSSSDEDDDDTRRLKWDLRIRKQRLAKILRTGSVPHMLQLREPRLLSRTPSPLPTRNLRESTPDSVSFEWINHRQPLSEFEVCQLENTLPNETPFPCGNVIVVDVSRNASLHLSNSPSICLNPDVLSRFVQGIRAPQPQNDESSDDDETNEDAAKTEQAEQASPPLENQDQYLRITFRDDEKNKPKTCLKRLSLRGFPRITDRSLEYLRDLSLELLDVQYTSVTADGVRNFVLQHPNCRVVHKTACVCAPRMHF